MLNMNKNQLFFYIIKLYHFFYECFMLFSIIPDRYLSVPIFISDRPSVFIGTDFFLHDFGKEDTAQKNEVFH